MMIPRLRARGAKRGYVLIFVLVVLLVLSLLVGALYVQAGHLRSANLSATYQQVAAANADRGLQEAIRALRTGDVPVSTIIGTCSGGSNYRVTCSPGSYAEPGVGADGGILIGSNGSVAPDGGFLGVEAGGGLQFSYVIFRSSTVLNQPTNRFTIQATGYAGNTEDSMSLVTAVVEAEIELSEATFKCVNAYDCSGS